MLDKLKDIVPDVNENKAKFIYEKGLARKAKFTFNYKLALRLVCLLIVLIPVVVFIGLGSNKFGNLNMGGESMDPAEPGASGDSMEKPGCNEEADVLEYFRYNLDKNTGILELYFYDYYDIYYIKEYSGYQIKSVSVDGVLIERNEGVYSVNSLDTVQIQFNGDINNKIEIYVSTNGEHFVGYCIYVK